MSKITFIYITYIRVLVGRFKFGFTISDMLWVTRFYLADIAHAVDSDSVSLCLNSFSHNNAKEGYY